MDPIIEEGATVLFQGDSITDAGRLRSDPDSMGTGYALMAAAWFSALHPRQNIRFLNRGISGDRARDLETRWEMDCLELQPSWISVMIGINDTWRTFDSNDPSPIVEYETSYRTILTAARDRLRARLILMEPFVLPVPEDRQAWRADLERRIEVVHTLAREFEAVVVPLDGVFSGAIKKREPAYWAPDGVHPTIAGHALIAQSWLHAVRASAPPPLTPGA